jgi:hypothetical protein
LNRPLKSTTTGFEGQNSVEGSASSGWRSG